MPEPTNAAIKLAIAKALQTAFPQVQVVPYLNTNPQPPCFDMIPADPGWEYDKAMGRGSDCVYIVVRYMVSWQDPVAAQTNLDALIDPTGPNSVKTAIETDTTLGGLVAWTRVTRASGYKAYPRSKIQMQDITEKIGVEFDVEIMT